MKEVVLVLIARGMRSHALRFLEKELYPPPSVGFATAVVEIIAPDEETAIRKLDERQLVCSEVVP
jgi:hypothetical protein